MSNTKPVISERAIYLPALQKNYVTYKVPSGGKYDDAVHNLFDLSKGFYYPYVLYSPGHALGSKDLGIIDTRLEGSLVVGDSGGYQLASGMWKLNTAEEKRVKVLKWQEAHCDVGIILDLPTIAIKEQGVSYQQCFDFTYDSAAYFEKHQSGACRFLNVVQGRDVNEAVDWYNKIKHFNLQGWAFAGNQSGDMYAVLKLLILMRDEGKLDKTEWIHILGISRLTAVRPFTALQYALREQGFDIQVTFDSASPSHTAKYLDITMPTTNDITTPTLDVGAFPKYNTLAEYIASRTNVDIETYVGKNIGPKEVLVKFTKTDTKTYHALTNHNMEQTILNIEKVIPQPERYDGEDWIDDYVDWDVGAVEDTMLSIFKTEKPFELLDIRKQVLKYALKRSGKAHWHRPDKKLRRNGWHNEKLWRGHV